MNLAKLRKNLLQQVQLRPIARQFAHDGSELAQKDDDWVVQEISDSEIRLSNVRTQQRVALGHDHVHNYTSNPERSQPRLKRGFLVLNVQISLRGSEVAVEPNSAPGKPVIAEHNVEAYLLEVTKKLDLLTNLNDPKKSLRAIKFLSESGFGNKHYHDFLRWAFPEFEDGLLAALRCRSFDELCERNGISIRLVPPQEEQMFFDQFYRRAPEVNSIWNGNSYFQRNRDAGQTFGIYLKSRSLIINQAALEDFRKLHSLFLAYVNSTVSEAQLHNEITPEGIVPPNY